MQPAISSSAPTLSRGMTFRGKTPSPMIPLAMSDGNTVLKMSEVLFEIDVSLYEIEEIAREGNAMKNTNWA